MKGAFIPSPAAVAIITLSLIAAPVAAHNGEPPPVPVAPTRLAIDRVKTILPPRWSWLHWWEANREPYLDRPSQDAPDQTPDEQRLQALRQKAAQAIIAAMEGARKESLAIESALALGKMRHPAALDSLKALAQRSDSPRVRAAAIVSIGLLSTEQAQADLGNLTPRTIEERVAGFAAIGLLGGVDPEALKRLRGDVGGVDPAVAAVACWSLRQHPLPDAAAYYESVLIENESPWVASEALLALGDANDDRSTRLLADVLLGSGRHVVAWRNLQEMHDMRSRAMLVNRQRALEYQTAFDAYQRAYERLRKVNPNLPPAQEKQPFVRGGTIEMGAELIQLAWLRASAAIALGRIADPRAHDALCRFIELPAGEDEHLVMPKGIAIMSLAAHPSERSRDRLIALLGKNDKAGNLVIDAPRDSALRGFAALALGLYGRPYNTDQGPADRVGYDWAIETLAERLQDRREDSETRTACALALGLTQRMSVVPILHRVGADLRPNITQDQPLIGYIMLSRALAGDASFIETAQNFLSTRDDVSMSGILARRCVVLALGVTRSSAAVPALTKAWHLNHFVNREVVLALRLLGPGTAAEAVLDRFGQSVDDEERAYLALVLGELYAAQQPTPLARLSLNNNYTVRNVQLRPLQSLANPFLFEYLIPSLGDNW